MILSGQGRSLKKRIVMLFLQCIPLPFTIPLRSDNEQLQPTLNLMNEVTVEPAPSETQATYESGHSLARVPRLAKGYPASAAQIVRQDRHSILSVVSKSPFSFATGWVRLGNGNPTRIVPDALKIASKECGNTGPFKRGYSKTVQPCSNTSQSHRPERPNSFTKIAVYPSKPSLLTKPHFI